MGRGGGCLPSKSPRVVGGSPPQSPKSHHSESAQQDQSAPVAAREPPQKINTIKVYIIYYSMYGHVEALAKKVKDGVDSVEGTEGILFRVAETLSQQVLEKMHAPPKNEEIPIITSAQLTEADAFLFGFPTRYGAMAAQMKAFFDTTGGLWQKQSLAGKPAGFFVSTGTQGGGQETTAWTAITQLVHHGMLFVPIGYTYGAGMFKLDEIRGGSPYGAGTYAGDGSRLPSEDELALAEHQGRYTAGIVKKLIGTK